MNTLTIFSHQLHLCLILAACAVLSTEFAQKRAFYRKVKDIVKEKKSKLSCSLPVFCLNTQNLPKKAN